MNIIKNLISRFQKKDTSVLRGEITPQGLEYMKNLSLPPKPTILTSPILDVIKSRITEEKERTALKQEFKHLYPERWEEIMKLGTTHSTIMSKMVKEGKISEREAEIFAPVDIGVPMMGMKMVGPKAAQMVGAERVAMTKKALEKKTYETVNKPLEMLDDFWNNISFSTKAPGITKIQKEISRVGGLRLSGKLTAQEANKQVTQLNKELLKTAKQAGIAFRETKAGKLVPAIRQSGPFVSKDFANTKFKDVYSQQYKDVTRFIQEGDLGKHGGKLQENVLWRTRDMIKMRNQWLSNQESFLKGIVKNISNKEAMTANKVLLKVSSGDAKVSPEKLLQRTDISNITKDPKVIEFAQRTRTWLDQAIGAQNHFRQLRGQDLIPYRQYYSADTLRKTSLWEKAYSWGSGKLDPFQIMGKGTPLPDFINPNKPFNPRELAKLGNVPEFAKEMNLKKIIESYANTAAKDIFNTSIIQNNKVFSQQLNNMGYKGLSRGIDAWTSEAFAGIKGGLDRNAALGPTIEKGMSWWRQALVRNVFPLNIRWNALIQTSSANLTVTRYGTRNSARAMFDWVTNPKIRNEISKNAYSYMVKTGKGGKITMQDVNKGMSRAVQLEKGKLETTRDAANYFTEWTEKHLTGWSVRAAQLDGQKRGLTGKSLWEWASDGGAKTQSMYNIEDIPGILRNETVKTIAPFNTFSFEVMNTMKEFAGKTGVAPATAGERIKWAIRFLAGVNAVNSINQSATGRKPWEIGTFIPFYGTLFAPVVSALKGENYGYASTRGLPAPVGVAIDLGQSLNKWVSTGNSDKIESWALKNLPGMIGLVGGVQIERMVSGLKAIADGGVKDSGGRMLFPIYDTKDKVMAILAGKWATEGGKEYWKEREKSWLDFLNKTDTKKEPLPGFNSIPSQNTTKKPLP